MKTKTQKTNSKIVDKLYFYFFLLLPLVYSDKVIDPVLVPRQLYLTAFVCILGVIILFQISKKELVPDFSFLKLTLPILLFIFLLINCLSLFKATSIADGIYVLSKFTIEILFFVISTYLIAQNKLTTDGLIKAIVSFCIVSISIALYQAVTLDFSNSFRYNIYQITSTYANKNLFSSVLFLTFPFVIGGIVILRKWKVTSIVLLCSIITLLLLIQTRAVLFATFLFFLIVVIFQKGHLLKRHLLKLIPFLIISLCIIGAVLFYLKGSSYYSNLIDSRSLPERLLVWNNSLQMAKENIFQGVGAGNWQFQFPKYGLEKFNDVFMDNASLTYQRPHNDFLWVLCETGILGLITYISVFIVALFYTIKLLRNKIKPNLEDKLLLYAFFATIAGYAFISFFDFPLERIEHQILFYLILSIVVAKYYCSHEKVKTSTNSFNFGMLTLMIFVPVLFSFVVSTNRFSGEFHTRKIYECQSKGDWNQLISEADNSVNPFYVTDPTSIPINWYKGVALYTSGNLKEAQGCFEKAKLIHPYNIHVLNNLASCYETEGKHKEAEEMYLKALLISPRFDEARLNLSAVYFNEKKYEKAFHSIDKVDVTTKDEKYQIYLPVILNSWLGVILPNQKDEVAIQKISTIRNSQTKMIEFYFASKKSNIAYLQYILDHKL
ncbi:MAG: O-antigen ligase family protein [Paludibacter sp.]|nr:O-antigen ligase family protein [Paludibacter sp.]